MVRPNRVLTVLSYVSLAVGAGFVGLLGSAAIPLVMLFTLCAAATMALARNRKWPHFDYGLVEADENGVRLRGKKLVDRKDIKQGLALPVGDACVVRLERAFPRSPIDLAVYDENAGRKLLVALGLDASQTTVELAGGSGMLRMSRSSRFLAGAGLVAAVFAVTGLIGNGGLPDWWWLLFLPLGKLTTDRPSKIRIGVDGVHFRWLWVSEFTPFSSVRSVWMREDNTQRFVDLIRTDGTKTSIPVGKQDGEQDLVHQRIVQAFKAYEARQGSAGTEALARGSRTPMEWLTALRGLGAGANAGLRTAHIDTERLWAIVEDPSATPAARAGAAAALASSASKPERERIRIAAGTIAEPRLRVAVEKAADETVAEAELAEALAEVDDRPITRAS